MMSVIKNNKLFTICICALFVMLFWAYSNHFNNPFQFDDGHTIVSNKYIRELKNIPLFFKDASTFSSLPANQNYRPLTTTLNAIDFWLGGKPEPVPFYYHLSIFISYVLLGLMLFFLFLKIFNYASENQNNKWWALTASAFYMLHTANAETINYIIARTDSFSTLMIVVAFVIYLYKPQWRKKHIYIIPMIVGFFAKEPAIMFFPLLFAYIFLFEQNQSIGNVFTKEGFKNIINILKQLSLVLIIVIALIYLSTIMLSQTFDVGEIPKANYILTQPIVIIHYIMNFILPIYLSADTDWTMVNSLTDERVFWGLGFLIILISVIWKTSEKKETRPIAFGLLWFLISLLPTSLVPLSEVLNDHRTFLPYIGLTMTFIWFFAYHVNNFIAKQGSKLFHKISTGLFVSIVLCAHTYGTHKRCDTWSSEEKLWYDVTIKSPNNGRGLMNYGNALMAKKDYDNALKYYQLAMQLIPNYSYLHVNIAILRNAMGFSEEAERFFKQGIQLGGNNPECYYFYAQFLIQKLRMDDASKVIDAGLKISPGHTNLIALQAIVKNYDDKSSTLNNKSDLDLAIIEASNNPTHDNYIKLSLQYYLVKDYVGCVKAAEEALKINPKSDIAYNNICSAYNMLKDWPKAVEAGKKGLSINPNNELLINNLKESLSHINDK